MSMLLPICCTYAMLPIYASIHMLIFYVSIATYFFWQSLERKHDTLKFLATTSNGGLLPVVSATMDTKEYSLGVLHLLYAFLLLFTYHVMPFPLCHTLIFLPFFYCRFCHIALPRVRC